MAVMTTDRPDAADDAPTPGRAEPDDTFSADPDASPDGRLGKDGTDGAARWDAGDPRRRDDQMAPPSEPCECHCLHCGRTFMSDRIWFQKVIGDPTGFDGFWMCPTPNCGGAGFTFDIFPTDPDHPANDGCYSWDEDDEDEEGAEYNDFEDEDDDDDAVGDDAGAWDPEEAKYRELDALYGDEEDDDIDGEEWKYGLAPGELPPGYESSDAARQRWEDEQRKYDAPDERPREIDWSNRDDLQRPGGDSWREEDIPF